MFNFNLKKIAELKEENEKFRGMIGNGLSEIAQLKSKNSSLEVINHNLNCEVKGGEEEYRKMKKHLEDKLNEVIGKYCDANLICLELTDKYNDLLDMSRGKTEE